MSWGVSPWVYPVWDSLGFLDLGDYFLPHFREVFNKDLEEIKKSQYIMNNAINEIKNTLEATNSRITEAEERISELEDRMVEINESERIKEK